MPSSGSLSHSDEAFAPEKPAPTHAVPVVFARPGMQSRLFVAQVLAALQIQLLLAQRDAPQPWVKGALAPWQLQRAKARLAADLQGRVSVSEVAAQCGLSRGYFCQAFRRSTGSSPHRWLQGQRIERAKALLLQATPIVEVASCCGFVDQSHLTRVFGRVVGIPPARWRALHR